MNEKNYEPISPVLQTLQYYQPKPKLKIISDKKDFIVCLIMIFFSIFTIYYTLLSGFNIGVPIFNTIFNIIIFTYLWKEKLKRQYFAYFTAFSSIVISISFAIYSDAFSKFIFFWVIVFLNFFTVSFSKGFFIYSKKSFRCLLDLIRVTFVVPFTALPIATVSAINYSKSGKKTNLIKGLLIGFACALPALAIIISLLMASDEAFEKLVLSVFDFNFIKIFTSVIIGIILFFYFFSQMFSIRNIKRKHKESKNTVAKKPSQFFIIAVTTFLICVSVVYIVFLLSQISYFTNGFLNIRPKNFTFAQYARRGFFEMSVICFINLAIIFLSYFLTNKRKSNIVIKGINVFLSIFSIILGITVLSKLVMYISNYGLTFLRVITFIFTVLLILMFILVIIKLFVSNFSYMKTAIAITLIVAMGVSLVNINSFIATYNYNNYVNGSLSKIDVNQYNDLGDEGVKYLFMLINDKKYSQKAKENICSLSYNYFNYEYDDDNEYTILIEKSDAFDASGYNYYKNEAYTLMYEHKAEIQKWNKEIYEF